MITTTFLLSAKLLWYLDTSIRAASEIQPGTSINLCRAAGSIDVATTESNRRVVSDDVSLPLCLFVCLFVRNPPPSEQLLHMWFETLCSSVKVVEKWYYPWSYIRSPGWVQIKCELRYVSTSSCIDNVPSTHCHHT